MSSLKLPRKLLGWTLSPKDDKRAIEFAVCVPNCWCKCCAPSGICTSQPGDTNDASSSYSAGCSARRPYPLSSTAKDDLSLPQLTAVAPQQVFQQHTPCSEFEILWSFSNMFQCIIQRNNGLIYNSSELRNVFPGRTHLFRVKLFLTAKSTKFDHWQFQVLILSKNDF